MTSRAEVSRLAALNGRIVDLVIADLNAFWLTLDMSSPADARDRLLEFLPLLVERYGDLAATVSADWYSEVRSSAGVSGAFVPVLAATVPAVKVTASTRRLAAGLFDGKPEGTLFALQSLMPKYALQSGRDTIVQAVRRDPRRPKFARVPTGATTCSFCLRAASRGAVYWSADKAGESSKFHPHDDCQIVVVFKGQSLPEGYDPDELYDEYRASKQPKKSVEVDRAEIDRAAALNRASYEAYGRGDLAEMYRLQDEARRVATAAYAAAGAGLSS